METTYTARKVQPKGKESFVIEFRHPVLLGPNGKRGRKIRKGLAQEMKMTLNFWSTK